MSSSDREGDEGDERPMIGRKRRYPSSDETEGEGVDDPSESENGKEGGTSSGTSSERLSSNHESMREAEQLRQGYDSSRMPPSVSESESRALGYLSESRQARGSMGNVSFLVSSSSDTNHNNSTSDSSSLKPRAAQGSQVQGPVATTVDLLGSTEGLGGLNQAQLLAHAQLLAQEQARGHAQASLLSSGFAAAGAADAAAALGGAVSPELMNLYRLNLIQLMNSQSDLLAQQGAQNQAILPTLPQQAAALNPFLLGNPYSSLLYQQAMTTEAQRLQLAGLMSGASPLAFAVSMGGDAAAARGAAANVASLSGFTRGLHRNPAPSTEGPLLYMPADDDILSDQQVLIRKQIELFAADTEDICAVTPGRRKEIVLGQVGIRCRYCAHVPIHHRAKGAVYYPAKLKGIYQAAQNMASSHFCDSCNNIDPYVKAELKAYQLGKSSSGHGGKQYWADSARILGVMETENEGLCFDPNRKYNKRTGKAERR